MIIAWSLCISRLYLVYIAIMDGCRYKIMFGMFVKATITQIFLRTCLLHTCRRIYLVPLDPDTRTNLIDPFLIVVPFLLHGSVNLALICRGMSRGKSPWDGVLATGVTTLCRFITLSFLELTTDPRCSSSLLSPESKSFEDPHTLLLYR